MILDSLDEEEKEMVTLGGVVVRVFIALTKHHDHNVSWGGKGLFSLHALMAVPH